MMANLTMPDKEIRSRRFLQFMSLSGLDRPQALGQLLLFWDCTRTIGLAMCPVEAVGDYLHDGDSGQKARIVAALLEAGYVAESPDDPTKVVIDGNARAITYTESRRARGRNGAQKVRAGRAAGKKIPSPAQKAAPQGMQRRMNPAAEADTEFRQACRNTWVAYAQAYEMKTCHPPVRNAKLNAQIQQIVKRLGYAQSPEILRFYVEQVTDKAVVENLWSLDLFLRRAEAYATQHKMGRPLHAKDAQNMSDSAAYYARQRALLDGA